METFLLFSGTSCKVRRGNVLTFLNGETTFLNCAHLCMDLDIHRISKQMIANLNLFYCCDNQHITYVLPFSDALGMTTETTEAIASAGLWSLWTFTFCLAGSPDLHITFRSPRASKKEQPHAFLLCNLSFSYIPELFPIWGKYNTLIMTLNLIKQLPKSVFFITGNMNACQVISQLSNGFFPTLQLQDLLRTTRWMKMTLKVCALFLLPEVRLHFAALLNIGTLGYAGNSFTDLSEGKSTESLSTNGLTGMWCSFSDTINLTVTTFWFGDVGLC